MIEKKIEAFLKQLELGKFGDHFLIANNINNPYKDGKKSVPYENLKKYLLKMLALKPSVLLVGEAPGYNGCRLTGIPFTSERVMAVNDFFEGFSGYKKKESECQTESTATKVWPLFNELIARNKMPLLWNIFPYHPHEKGNPEKSNRAPLKGEIDFGFMVLRNLIDIFETIETVYAVGRKAEEKINSNTSIIVILNKRRVKLGRDKHPFDLYINHPSYGGKDEFIDKIKRYII